MIYLEFGLKFNESLIYIYYAYMYTLILMIQGNTALDMVLERLASKAESGQSYELEEEHTAIRELLSREMKKLGYEPPPPRMVCSHRHSNEERTAARGKRSDGRRQARQKQAQKEVLIAYNI